MKVKTRTAVALAGGLLLALPAAAQPAQPWMNPALSPERRADLVLRQMTLDEEVSLVHGSLGFFGFAPKEALGSAGYVPGIPRLGIPAQQESDASLGVANPLNIRKGDGATPLPAGLATAATFNPYMAYLGGAMIGSEAWRKGFNVLLAGGANVARDPRNGRNFEYLGEDPLLTGTLAGEAIRGVQSQHVISTTKHFAVNDQETGRMVLNATIGEAAMRETDLLAFELAIERGEPGSVMCAYNRVDGAYACENDYLLNRTLKGDWKYPGYVMSDWGAVHSLDAANKGLDQESGQQIDKQVFFDKPLKAGLADGSFKKATLDGMVHRILRSMFAQGAVDHPPTKTEIDYDADALIAQHDAEQGVVLLKNAPGALPLAKAARRIAVIGSHADVGVLSGGGSSQVLPVGGPALSLKLGGTGMMAQFRTQVWDPSSPLKAIKAKAVGAAVDYDPGTDPAAAAALAKGADVAIVFVNQWMIEGEDAKTLQLPGRQDALVSAVAAANPHTIVVMETGNPVLMPWLDRVSAVMEAWYPGARGGEAIANILFGDVNPSGHLPLTFPRSEAQLPRPALPGLGGDEKVPFDVAYPEGANLGYRGYEATRQTPLFPFGFGLSYTSFRYSNLTVRGGRTLEVGFDVTNTGARTGMEAPQVYATAPGAASKRLIGFSKIDLQPGQTRRVTVTADPRVVAAFDETAHDWRLAGGSYAVVVGGSSADAALTGAASVVERRIAP
jgi:beta-glucosidase